MFVIYSTYAVDIIASNEFSLLIYSVCVHENGNNGNFFFVSVDTLTNVATSVAAAVRSETKATNTRIDTAAKCLSMDSEYDHIFE